VAPFLEAESQLGYVVNTLGLCDPFPMALFHGGNKKWGDDFPMLSSSNLQGFGKLKRGAIIPRPGGPDHEFLGNL